ncbi:MAG: hypothetical protein L0322_12690, partial [Chloroflexi bacterium]|nr:hypothetical protein [Chloroflexota bacterium]
MNYTGLSGFGNSPEGYAGRLTTYGQTGFNAASSLAHATREIRFPLLFLILSPGTAASFAGT